MFQVKFFFKQLIATILAIFTMIGGIFVPVPEKDICMIAHRGYSGKYPENTALAFEKAAEHGSGGAETDIRRTKDGIYVTSHDSEVIYEDGSTLIIEENTYEQLTQKPLENKKTKDKVYLCTFKNYLEIMRDNDMVCFVELKGAFTDEQVKEIFQLAEETYCLEKCILQSFNFDNLIKAKELFPNLPVMLTYGTSDTGYERCFEYGISIDANLNQISDEMIEQFHERGLLVAAYTANNFMQLCYGKSYDLDFLESDYYA
ncbi:MAG: hypothetical protein MJ147_01245 [Clostridia bacterium]|nr:hypothetical protein [Clostridia bacterium]